MDDCVPLACFGKEWQCYLEQHGHRLRPSKHPGVLVSKDGKGKRYRWLLWAVEGGSMLVREGDLRTIRSQVRLARKAGQLCFVVVKFGHPGGSAIAVPASQAMKVRLLGCDKGAIPWEP